MNSFKFLWDNPQDKRINMSYETKKINSFKLTEVELKPNQEYAVYNIEYKCVFQIKLISKRWGWGGGEGPETQTNFQTKLNRNMIWNKML